MTTHLPGPSETADPQAVRRSVSVDRFTASVTRLLDEREDLQGVTPMADLVRDAVRWTA